MSTAAIALGANLGDRLGTLREAVARLAALGRVTAVSRVYETAPVGHLDQPRFFNAAVLLETERSPEELLSGLHAIEAALGRVRSFRNAPRTLDLDLLLYDDVVHESDRLTLPHPRLHERAFVLLPLAEIAPHATHPTLGVTIAELLTRLGEVTDARVVASLPADS